MFYCDECKTKHGWPDANNRSLGACEACGKVAMCNERHSSALQAQNKNPMDSINGEEPIHEWFELSYAQYLTVPRTVLQSMPVDWQQKFVKLLEEMDEAIDWRPDNGRYWVQLKDENGRYFHDHLMDYDRGRRKLSLKTQP